MLKLRKKKVGFYLSFCIASNNMTHMHTGQTRKAPIPETATGEVGTVDCSVLSKEVGMVHAALPTAGQDVDHTKLLPLQRIASSPETLTKSNHHTHNADHENHTAAHSMTTGDVHTMEIDNKVEERADKRTGYRDTQPVDNYRSLPDVRTQSQPLFASLPTKSPTTSTVSQQRLLESQELIESQSAAISGESIQSFLSSSSQQLPTQISISIGNSNGPVDIHISDNSGNSSLSPPPVTVTNTSCVQQPRRSSTTSSHTSQTHKSNKYPATTQSAVVERTSAMCSTLHEVSSSEEQSDDFRKGSGSPAVRQSENISPRQSRSPIANDCSRSHVPEKNKAKCSGILCRDI